MQPFIPLKSCLFLLSHWVDFLSLSVLETQQNRHLTFIHFSTRLCSLRNQQAYYIYCFPSPPGGGHTRIDHLNRIPHWCTLSSIEYAVITAGDLCVYGKLVSGTFVICVVSFFYLFICPLSGITLHSSGVGFDKL